MARRSKRQNAEALRIKLVELLQSFEDCIRDNNLREQVLALVPVNYLLRDLGSSLIKDECASAARDRILFYLRKYPRSVIDGDELMVVAGISEYARRLRELRVQLGWSILSGVTIAEMRENAAEEDAEELDLMPVMRADQYFLQSDEQDRGAAHRWNTANVIRKRRDLSVQKKMLLFFRENVGVAVSGEELRYISGNKSEWARRVRELRTEEGWAIATKHNGNPDLPISTYVLTSETRSPPHDRMIKDKIRREVLQRDDYKCQRCSWVQGKWNPSDPRHLEVHHRKYHVEGGLNTKENLLTYCNICHDQVHVEEGSVDG